MVPIYYRNGSVIFWIVEKRFVVELRLPLFIWRTNGKKKVVLNTDTKMASREVKALKFGIPILSYSGKKGLPGRMEREAT